MRCVLKDWNTSMENQQSTSNLFGLSVAGHILFKPSTKSTLCVFYSKFHELLVAKVRLARRASERERIERCIFEFSLHSTLRISYMNMEDRTRKRR